MKTYALIENGQEARQIVLKGDDKLPDGDWRPVVVEGLDFDRSKLKEVRRDTRIDPDKVARVVQTEPITLTQQDYATAIQAHVDATAASKGYGDGYALASYKDSTVPAWASEANAFIAWRDSVWLAAYLLMGEVAQGLKAQPSVPDLMTQLPTIEWPS